MKKLFPIALMILGVVFVAAGGYTISRGLEAKDLVRDQLAAQKIVTPADASIPNVPVADAATAQSMAEIIDEHARASTGGLTYAEMGRFMTPDGDPAGTDDPAVAAIGSDGKPVANQLRNTAFQASALQTSLYTSVMAFNIGDLVLGLGLMLGVLGLAVGGVGVALAGLAIPAVATRFRVTPAVATA